jgi:hypothetical protein
VKAQRLAVLAFKQGRIFMGTLGDEGADALE